MGVVAVDLRYEGDIRKLTGHVTGVRAVSGR